MLKKIGLALVVVPLVSLCLSLSLSSQVLAENISLRSESMIRLLERDTASEKDALIIPVYEYMQLDFGKPDETMLTFHANGWGRADLTDNDYFSDQTEGELLYGYLEYRSGKNGFMTRLGRQAVFAGVASESIDGIYLDTALPSSLKLSLYAGQPVSLVDTNGRDGDSIYGGRLSIRRNNLDLGVSYKLIENDSNDAEEMAGIDYGFSMDRFFFSGLSSYNLVTEDFAEHSFDAAYTLETDQIRAFYHLFTFKDYFGTDANNANPFRILALASEELSNYGLEFTRNASAALNFGIKLSRNDYDLKESSNYLAVLADWSGDSSSLGGEFGISEGENGRNDMMIARGYITTRMGGNKIVDQLSLDLLYALYDQPIFGEDSSLFASVAASRKLSKRITLKISADYESNPYFNSDIRGFASLVYNYTAN